MSSGRIAWASGSGRRVRSEMTWDESVVKASQRPDDVGCDHLDETLEDDGLVRKPGGREVVGEVLLVGGAGLHADAGAGELTHRRQAQRLAHHEGLAVVVHDAGEVEPERRVAAHGPGRVARKDVDLSRLQRREPLLGVEGHEADLARVLEHGGGDGAAEVGVDAGPLALVVGSAEAGETRVDAAREHAARAHGLERSRLRRCSRARQCGSGCQASEERTAGSAGTPLPAVGEGDSGGMPGMVATRCQHRNAQGSPQRAHGFLSASGSATGRLSCALRAGRRRTSGAGPPRRSRPCP